MSHACITFASSNCTAATDWSQVLKVDANVAALVLGCISVFLHLILLLLFIPLASSEGEPVAAPGHRFYFVLPGDEGSSVDRICLQCFRWPYRG